MFEPVHAWKTNDAESSPGDHACSCLIQRLDKLYFNLIVYCWLSELPKHGYF
jgi:hypothetical protein